MPGNYPRTRKRRIRRDTSSAEIWLERENKLAHIAHKVEVKGVQYCRSLDSAKSLAWDLNSRTLGKYPAPTVMAYNKEKEEWEFYDGTFVAANSVNPRVIMEPVRPLEDIVNGYEVRRLDERSEEVESTLRRQDEMPLDDVHSKNDVRSKTDNVGFEDVHRLESGLRGDIVSNEDAVNPAYTGVAMMMRNKPDSPFPNLVRFNEYRGGALDDDLQREYVTYASRQTNLAALNARGHMDIAPSPKLRDRFDTDMAIKSAMLFSGKATHMAIDAMNRLPKDERRVYLSDKDELRDAHAHFDPAPDDKTLRGIYLNVGKATDRFIASGGLHHEVNHVVLERDNAAGFEDVYDRIGENPSLKPVLAKFEEVAANRMAYRQVEDKKSFRNFVQEKLAVRGDSDFVRTYERMVLLTAKNQEDAASRMGMFADFAEKAATMKTVDPKLHKSYMGCLEASKDDLGEDYGFVKGLVNTFERADRKGFIKNLNSALDYSERYI